MTFEKPTVCKVQQLHPHTGPWWNWWWWKVCYSFAGKKARTNMNHTMKSH
jgi:hypothetical protein